MNFFESKILEFFDGIWDGLYKIDGSGSQIFSWLFIIFMGIFALATIVVIFATFFSYEFVLTRAIDKINKFLSKNPRINEDNLVAFNNKMKNKKIPKPLRRQWQQFMIYREHEASHYMSFKHCVENPLKTSTYHQQMSIYKVVSLILVCLAVLVGVFCVDHIASTLSAIFKYILVIPIFILILYWLISLLLNLIHNATTADLYQNYQYFEINIDKATTTLPEYVDYEVLFTQDEIKRGIPVLFEYIQKRAIEEQKELERARIKNVEHEKFNFDESGLDASLVLERSMKEAEDYIATRKKFRQDIEQVNNEINALDNQYKENIKENQKLMQTSKESVDGLKKQLEQATSTIEINYIKKQMKDELNRQQVAERDFDALTDKHNKEVKSLQEEVARLEGEIESARKALETSMMSEFGSYSIKVFKKVEDKVNLDQKSIIEDYERRIHDLEERLSLKDEELDNVYSQYQTQLTELEQKSKNIDSILKEKDDIISQVQGALEGKSKKSKSKKNLQESEAALESFDYSSQNNETVDSNNDFADFNYQDDNSQSVEEYNQEGAEPQYNYAYDDQNTDYQTPEFNYQDETPVQESFEQENISEQEFNYQDNGEEFNYTDSEPENNPENLTFDYTSNQEETAQNSEEDFSYVIDDTAFDRFDASLSENNENNQAQENPESEEITFNYLDNEEESEPVKEVEETSNTETDKADEEDDKSDSDKALEDLFKKWDSVAPEDDIDDLADEEEETEVEPEKDADKDADDGESELDKLFEKWFGSKEENSEETETVDETEDESEDEDGEENGEFLVDETLTEDEEDVQEEVEKEQKSTRKAGRPKKNSSKQKIDFDFLVNGDVEKEVKETVKEERPVLTKRVGRPKKEEAKEAIDFAFLVDGVESKKRRGRPRKTETVVVPAKRKAGRPKKVEEKSSSQVETKRVGRPKKVSSEVVKRSVGRPKKEEIQTKRGVGRPRKANPVGRPKKARPVGRPRKATVSSKSKNINEIDKKLKELNKQIKKENANIAKAKRQLANANIRKTNRRK